MQGIMQIDYGKKCFIDSVSGKPYMPVGVNYFDHETGWAPQIWKQFDESRVREQFQVMKSYGINAARFFIASTAFVPEKNKIDMTAIEKFDKFVVIAKESNIHIIPTGPDHWEGVPGYCRPDMYCNPGALEALQTYWSFMSKRYKDEPVVFAWDLRNEPMINWDSEPMRYGWKQFLINKYGNDEQDFSVPADEPNENNPRLYDYQLYREQVAYNWTKTQVEAIRNAGDKHLVTIGYIQWSFPAVTGSRKPSGYSAFNPKKLSGLIDFDCPHFYPTLGDPIDPAVKRRNINYLLDWVRYCDLSRPVALEEFGWYGGGEIKEHNQPYRSAEDQLDWNQTLMEETIGIASGWLNWPLADTESSTDISKYSGIITSDLQPKPWGEAFKRYAAQLSGGDNPLKKERVQLNFSEDEFKRFVTTGGDNERYS